MPARPCPAAALLTIETRNESESAGDFARLSVSDTGVGMDDRTRQHVFEPFFTTKSMSKGNGLGLATVFGVVTQAGGHLAVSSEPGKGLGVQPVVSRACMRRRTPMRKLLSSVPQPRTSGAVLLVEDEAEVRRLAGTILGTWASPSWRPATPARPSNTPSASTARSASC